MTPLSRHHIYWLAAAAFLVPGAAAAQTTPGCAISWNNAQSGALRIRLARLRAFVASCPQDPNVPTARRRIVALDRQLNPPPRPEPRPTRPRPEPGPTPVRPAPRVQTRSLMVQNQCSDPIKLRLVYSTVNGWRQPNGEYWTIASGATFGPLSYRNQRLELVSDEIYFHITRPDETVWTFSNPRSFNYGGTMLAMGRASVAVDSTGNYLIRFTCPAAAPSPSRSARERDARGIPVVNDPGTLPPGVIPGPYIVFFDWDKDEITPTAAAILDNAAAAYRQLGDSPVRIVLAGHTDRTGPEDYNIGLSQRRANNVRSYLAGRGVSDGAMTAEAFGESRPLVETADGVRQPQNRRVEITFGPGGGW